MSQDKLSGDLSFLELGELLQLLGTIGQSGVLHLSSPWSSTKGRIDIIKGAPVDASDGQKAGIDALYDLFGWKDGGFNFSNQQVSVEKRINKNRMNIILDAMRLMDEGKIKTLGPMSKNAQWESSQKSSHSLSLKLPLIRGESPDYSDIVDEERYADGQSIFMEGKFGRWVYVILDGKADVVKIAPQGPVTLLQLGTGTYPGTILFFTDEKARATSLVASGQTHLGVINLERLYSEFSGKSLEFQALAAGMAYRLKKITDTAALFHRNERLSKIDFHKKIPLALSDEGDNSLLMIQKGTGRLAIDRGDRIVHLANLKAGDVIGDLSFLDSALKLTGARVYGSNDMKVLKLDTHKLAEEYEQSSPTLAAMFKNQVVRTIVTCWLACRYDLNLGPRKK
ncbi:MAG: DUF4388 domain-containing protein [Thermodesulfobacteriota bacterium]|nr:DUF4388 domain-containing protein [Thermodesulfobacteriota bacterium]